MASIASDERLWEFQTRLMENVTGIVSEYRSNSGAGTSRATSTYNTYGGTIPPTMTAKIGPSVPTINTTGSASLLSQEDSSENYKFIDLPVSIVQLLVPKVEVYKVYPSEIEGQPDRAYLLHQGAHKSEDIRKELREGTITATDSNRRGVVLQAVDFTRLGGNPAEVHTNIKFNIKLYAKNITEFFTKADSFPDTHNMQAASFLSLDDQYDARMATYDSVLKQRDDATSDEARTRAQTQLDAITPIVANTRQAYIDATKLKQTAWIDIIKIDPGQELNAAVGTPSAATQPTPTSNQLQVVEKDVRIKVKIGYSLKNRKPSDNMDDEVFAQWQETAEKQQEEFFLSLLKHEWSFLGMQGVELSVDFVATGNAKALQPDKDLLGGVSFSSYDEVMNTGFSQQRAEKEVHMETANALRNDILINESRLQEIPSLIAGNDATIAVLRQRASDYEKRGTETFTLELSGQTLVVTGAQAAAALRVAASSGTEFGANLLLVAEIQTIGNAIEETEARIEACEEKIEAIQNDEKRLDNEINNVRAEFKMRLLRQLYLEYGEGSTTQNRKTRVFRARAASTLSYISNMTFFAPSTFDSVYVLDRNVRSDNLSIGGGGFFNTITNEIASPLTQGDERRIEAFLEGSEDIYTRGDFVFLGDIIEAAYETVNIQSSMEVGDSAELVRLQVEAQAAQAEFVASITARNLFGDEDLREDFRTKDANLREALREAQVPFALVGENDFTEILSRFDIVSTGKVTYPHPIDPRTNWITINISDIPISLDLFRAWWTERARRMNSYPIRDFIPDLMKFVTDMFRNLKYRKGVRHVEMKDYELPSFILNNVSYSDTWNAMETNKEGIYVSLGTDWFERYLNEAKSNGANRSTTVIEQADVSDMPRGDVPNIIFGQADKGILKQVSFEREDIPGHAEARLMTDRDSVASNIALREKYNVTLEMRGTTSFLPGSVLYLDITPIELGYTDEDNSYAKQLGLGGMYRVVSVQSSLGLDGKGNSWVTRLKTKWESFGDGTNGDPNAIGNTTISNGVCV